MANYSGPEKNIVLFLQFTPPFPRLSVLGYWKEKVAVRSYLGTLNRSFGRFIAFTLGGVSPSEAPMLIFCKPTSRISYLIYRNRVTAMSCTPKSSWRPQELHYRLQLLVWLFRESCSFTRYFPIKSWISILTEFIRISQF